MKRGDIVTIALQGDYGKPRPALIIQSDLFSELSSVTVLPITSHLNDLDQLRLNIEAGPKTGLTVQSQIMIDKAQTLPASKVGATIGAADRETMAAVNRALAIFFGIA